MRFRSQSKKIIKKYEWTGNEHDLFYSLGHCAFNSEDENLRALFLERAHQREIRVITGDNDDSLVPRIRCEQSYQASHDQLCVGSILTGSPVYGCGDFDTHCAALTERFSHAWIAGTEIRTIKNTGLWRAEFARFSNNRLQTLVGCESSGWILIAQADPGVFPIHEY